MHDMSLSATTVCFKGCARLYFSIYDLYIQKEKWRNLHPFISFLGSDLLRHMDHVSDWGQVRIHDAVSVCHFQVSLSELLNITNTCHKQIMGLILQTELGIVFTPWVVPMTYSGKHYIQCSSELVNDFWKVNKLFCQQSKDFKMLC